MTKHSTSLPKAKPATPSAPKPTAKPRSASAPAPRVKPATASAPVKQRHGGRMQHCRDPLPLMSPIRKRIVRHRPGSYASRQVRERLGAHLPTVERLLAVALLCSLTACGGSSSTPGGSPTVCPVPLALGDLNYPAGGATGVVDSQDIIVVSGGAPTATLSLSASSGPTLATTTVVAVPNPLPSPKTAIQRTPATAFRIPALAAATTYNVTGFGPGTCSAETQYGSFTTR